MFKFPLLRFREIEIEIGNHELLAHGLYQFPRRQRTQDPARVNALAFFQARRTQGKESLFQTIFAPNAYRTRRGRISEIMQPTNHLLVEQNHNEVIPDQRAALQADMGNIGVNMQRLFARRWWNFLEALD